MDFLRASRRFNVQSSASANPFWTSSVLPAASTSNPPLFLTPFGLPPAFPPLQRPIRRFCKSLLDFFPPLRCFNVQSTASANPFWTSSVLPAASTSNLPLFLTPFGLPPAFPPLQRPICRFCKSLLDFLRASRRFNVQSSASANPFWTSSVLPAASTSNLPLFLTPFGLPSCFPLLQRPICRFCKSLLDFLLPSRCFNVQSSALSHSFWTSSCLPAASTSNPPLFLTPFGLPPAFPPLQRPIRRSFSLLLDFFPPSRHFNVQSAALSHSFWTSSVLPAASTSNLPLLQIPFGLSPCFPPLQRPICRSFSLLLDFLPPPRRFNVQSAASTHAFVVYEYFINYHLTLILEYFIFLL